MNLNELRIGNYVCTSYMKKSVFKVNAIHSDRIYFESIVENFKSYTIPVYVEPIQLTEEWLLKAGFKYKKYHPTTIGSADVFGSGLYVSQMINNGFSLVFQTDKKSFYFEFSDRYIKYVHELQNIYFALTGVELVFTTEP